MSQDCDFWLELDRDGDQFRVHVQSPVGEVTTRVEVDPTGLVGDLQAIQTKVLASAAPIRDLRSVMPGLEPSLRQVGTTLFEAVLGGNVGALLLASRNQVEHRGERLRVLLRLPAELAVLPWELLFDADTGFVCRRSPLIRYVDAPEVVRPLAVDGPLRVLGMTALPGTLAPLDAETERQRLTEALAPLQRQGLVALDWVPGQRWEDLRRALFGECHLFHFIGHGGFDEICGEGVIAFADDHGRPHPIRASALAELLSVARPMPHLVVLNSCQTATGLASDVFSSTGAALVRRIPAVVAMQFAITDDAATAFSAAFYEALAHNRGVDEAVRLGRIALICQHRDTLEWITPVLYMHSRNTDLLTVAPDERAQAAVQAPTRPIERHVPVPPRKPHHLRLVVFSFNANLIGTESLLYEVTRDLISEYSYLHRTISRDSYASYVGMGEESFFSEMVDRYQIRGKSPFELVSEREERYLTRLRASDPGNLIKPGFRYILELLARRNVKMAICSSTSTGRVWATLEQAGIADYFTTCVTPDRGVPAKPSPEMLRLLLQEVDVQPSDCLVVESSRIGVSASVAAGCFTIILLNEFAAPIEEQFCVEPVANSLFLAKWFDDFFKADQGSR